MIEMDNHQGARTSFLSFVQLMWPEFQEAPYHQVIAGEGAMAVYAAGRRCILNAPPRIGMSTMISVMLPAWSAGVFGYRNTLVCHANSELADQRQNQMRDIMGSDLYCQIFPSRSSAGIIRHSGCFEAIGGFDAQVVIVDNILCPSDTQRRAIDWFLEVVSLRLSPDTSALVCETRSSKNDLTGSLLARQAGWANTRIRYSDFIDSSDQDKQSLRELAGEKSYYCQYDQTPIAA